jgi:microcystin degradation protein MlrC
MKGNQIIDEYRDSYHEIGGMIEELEKHNADILPVSFAEATPGGIISATTYELLLKELTTELSYVLPIDGCIISLHGAAVSENYADMDGHWLTVTRNLVGASKPIVGTLDPHANVSQQMVSATNALISYKTNPHIDQRETGKIAAELLIKIIKGEVKPFQYLCPSPVAISIEQQYTGTEPCLSLYNYVDNLIAEKSLLHISINLGFPYADVEEMGASFIIIHNEYLNSENNLCKQLFDYMKVNKENFIGTRKRIDQLLPEITVSEKPVLLLDMGDNIGGGSPGNSLHLLRVFEEQRKFKSLFCIYEPEAVKYLVGSKTDQILNISLRDIDESYFKVSVRVLQIVDGRFSESNPRHGGQVHYNMGTTAIVQTLSGSTIMLMSNRVPPFSLQQLTTFDLNPEQYDVIVAKGVIAPIAAYTPVCKTVFQVDTPGHTQVNMTSFNYRNRRKPLFPFENIS